MKILKNECLNKKLILVLLVVMFLCIIFPNVSHAGTASAIGGKLLQPVCDLLLALGDGIMTVIQKAIVGTGGDIAVDLTGTTGIIAKILGVVAAVVVIVAVTIATAGVGAWIAGLGGFLGTVLGSVASAGITTFVISAATLASAGIVGSTVANAFSGNNLPDVTMLPTFCVGPEEIFEGKLLVFDINFFNPKQVYVEFEDGTSGVKIQNYERYMISHKDAKVKRYYYEDPQGKDGKTTTSKQNTALQLSTTISKWYYSIRNIALIFMMLILLYIGIRMMLCSIASEKSKYKKMLGDWVVSMCLVFVLHYIMVFLVNINENVINVIKAATEKNQSVYILKLDDEGDDGMDPERKESFMKSLHEKTEGEFNQNYLDKNGNTVMKEGDTSDPTKSDSVKKETKGFLWVTNLVGRIRMSAQNQDGTTEYLGYAVAYLVLVFYTVFFVFAYLKRVLYMAFLTIIAPLVAMTYSIDKIADGKAQAFNIWLKEYIFNLLIQPMHLLLYLILISMAYDLASTNIIYTLVAIGFMIPAEKFVRKMFGFEKAQTPGFLGGAAGAALTMSGMQKLAHMAGHGPGPKGGKAAEKLDKSPSDDAKKIRTADSGRGLDALVDDVNGENNNSSGSMTEQSPLLLTGDNPEYVDGGMAEIPSSNLDLKDPDDPVAKMEREALEEKIADGQLTTDELSEDQKSILGLNTNSYQQPIFDGLSDEQGGAFELYDNNYQPNDIPTPPDDELINNEQRKDDSDQKEQQKKYQSWGETFKRRASKSAKNAFSKENIGNALSKSVKTGTKLMGTATGAAIGASIGIASGDINKVGQNMVLGATAGNSIGSSVGKSIVTGTSRISDTYKKNKTEYEKEKYGDRYSEHKKEEQDKEFLKDKEARKYFAQQCSTELSGLSGKERKEKLDSIMKEAVEYRKEGVTDNSIIVKARKLDRNNPTSNESKLAAVMATKAKDIEGMERYQKRIAKKLGDTKANEIAENASKLAGFYK